MTSDASDLAGRPVLSVRNRVGLALAGLLGLLELTSSLVSGPTPSDEVGPPLSVLFIDAVLGVITVAAAAHTWRSHSRAGSRMVAGSLIVSMITALPAFFVPGVPASLVALVGLNVVVSIVVVGLVVSRRGVPLGAGRVVGR